MKNKVISCLLFLISLILLPTFSGITCTPAPSHAPTPVPSPPVIKPPPTPSQRVMVGQTKILERQFPPPRGESTGELERWQVTLNWYAWEGDKVTVNITVTNIMQKKATAPFLSAIDSDGNYGGRVWEMESYSPKEIWPSGQYSGNEIFQFGPLSKGIKLWAYFIESTKLRVEFSLGR